MRIDKLQLHKSRCAVTAKARLAKLCHALSFCSVLHDTICIHVHIKNVIDERVEPFDVFPPCEKSDVFWNFGYSFTFTNAHRKNYAANNKPLTFARLVYGGATLCAVARKYANKLGWLV